MEDRDKLEQVRISFQLTRGDYVRAVRYYLRKSHLVSWVQIMVLVLALAVSVLLAWLMGRLSFLNTLILVVAAMVAGYGGWLYLVKPGRIYDGDPALAREVSFLFIREDITRQDKDSAAILEWDIKALWRGREFYYLFSEQEEGYTLLPLSAFSSEEERRHFEALALAACPHLRMKRFG